MATPVSQLYPELLHYTTLEGLRGILTSGCLWATDAAFLNDSSEISHFFDERQKALILGETRRHVEELACEPDDLVRMNRAGGVERIVRFQVDRLHSTLRSATLAMNRPFVLSLSGPSNDRILHSGLLSQWRGYGVDGGYAFVFDSQKLEVMLSAEAAAHHYMHVQIGDVYYHGIDPKIQPATPDIFEYEEIFKKGVGRIMRGGTAEETERFYEAVTALSCLYKHWGFWEEREVRVVVVPVSDEVVNGALQAPPQKEVLLFDRGESKIPYIKLFAPSRSAGECTQLPIKRVIVGPHKNREQHAESVKAELLSAGYDVEVVQSEIPYIGR